ncbi:MAG: lactoylglutathione lyase [Eubacteriaceae bacterium]|jgi:catechol 2,3-dioxygenase-like lactoylglutathione lyase family enzyme|nr:lactoylglutathione lyase [Eubacteriaceae bacterium]MDK2905233.1 lactoylglutathione lyase [Eubacteriaceae bacterium]MDK2935251.1 lactoylglutathione lyase [Eubacteriaceae bacterium]
MKLDGFGIFVDDMAVMVRFYRDVLGFEIKESEDTTNVYLEKDGSLFLLYRKSDFEAMTRQNYSYIKDGLNGHFEIALSVDDFAAVDQAFEAATRAGAKAVMPPTTEDWGQRTCYVADPEGNLIEIGSFNEGKNE